MHNKRVHCITFSFFYNRERLFLFIKDCVRRYIEYCTEKYKRYDLYYTDDEYKFLVDNTCINKYYLSKKIDNKDLTITITRNAYVIRATERFIFLLKREYLHNPFIIHYKYIEVNQLLLRKKYELNWITGDEQCIEDKVCINLNNLI